MQGVPAEGALHPLWRELRDAAGRVAYLNPFTGRLAAQRFPPPPPVRGGILADEMVAPITCAPGPCGQVCSELSQKMSYY